MQFISVPGLPQLNIIRAGPRGQIPVVLLHPLGFDLTWWSEQIAALGRDHDVVAIDLPGHGLSGYPDGPPTFGAMADAVGAVIDHIDAGPVHLVGISVGGMVAQAFTLRQPDHVRSLVLVATSCTFAEGVREAIRGRARVTRAEGMASITALSIDRWLPAEFRARRPDMLDRIKLTLARQDAEFHARLWDMVAELDLEAQLSQIACKTLVVVGGADPSATRLAGEMMTDRIAGAAIEEMPGIGHFPPFEAPDHFNSILRAFLSA